MKRPIRFAKRRSRLALTAGEKREHRREIEAMAMPEPIFLPPGYAEGAEPPTSVGFGRLAELEQA